MVKIMNNKLTSKYCLILLVVTTAYCLRPIACSAAFDEYLTGARVRAMGGALAATSDDVNGVLGQPAALSSLVGAQLSVSYGQLYMGLSDGSKISDSSALFGMALGKHVGVGAAYQSLSLNSTYRENTALLAAGVSLAYGLRAGVAAKMLTASYGRDGYTEIDPVFAGAMSKSALDGDAGIMWQATKKISFGYTRNNMLGADLGLAQTAPLNARDTLALGYREEDFIFALEQLHGGSHNRITVGLEKLLAKHLLALRLGFGLGEREYRKISTGFGVNMKQFTLDYAFEYPMSGIEGTSGSHYITICTRFSAPEYAEPEKCPATQLPSVQTLVPAPPQEEEKPLHVETVEANISTACADVAPAQGSKLQLLNLLQIQQFSVALATATAEQQAPVVSSAVVRQEVVNVVAQSTAPAKVEKVASQPAEKLVVEEPVDKMFIEQMPAKQAVPQTSGKYIAIHRVAQGDTLPSLAEKYYRARARWIDIYEANRDKIEKGVLQAGQILIIP
jgi:LysM repeat protein